MNKFKEIHLEILKELKSGLGDYLCSISMQSSYHKQYSNFWYNDYIFL